jgi:Zn-dependent peptidase ImmA (M78 family)
MSSPWATVIEAARKLRAKYHRENQSLQETIRNICHDNNIILDYDIHGEKAKRKDGRWLIILPLDSSQVRDNFTVAHEFGHIFLGHPCDTNNEVHRSGERNEREAQANLFAAEFLMPKEEFTQAAREFNNDEQKLAKKFEVSQAAALVRLSALRLKK